MIMETICCVIIVERRYTSTIRKLQMDGTILHLKGQTAYRKRPHNVCLASQSLLAFAVKMIGVLGICGIVSYAKPESGQNLGCSTAKLNQKTGGGAKRARSRRRSQFFWRRHRL
jgi:hypothetical protein